MRLDLRDADQLSIVFVLSDHVDSASGVVTARRREHARVIRLFHSVEGVHYLILLKTVYYWIVVFAVQSWIVQDVFVQGISLANLLTCLMKVSIGRSRLLCSDLRLLLFILGSRRLLHLGCPLFLFLKHLILQVVLVLLGRLLEPPIL